MWRTPCGDRVLAGKERALFVHGAARLLDRLPLLDERDDRNPDHVRPILTGVACFDRLEVQAQVSLIRDIVQALTDARLPAPVLTSANEAAVYAVFRFIRDRVEAEVVADAIEVATLNPSRCQPGALPRGDRWHWRRLVVEAHREIAERNGHGDKDDGEGNRLAGEDVDCWWTRLEVLADRILWDRDWELEELIVDETPDCVRRLKDELDITDDYFVSLPTLLKGAQVEEAVGYVRRIAEGTFRKGVA
jgi:hypothetical protein